MAVWLVRAGSHGEYEQKFIQENRIYVTWDYLNQPLDTLKDRDELLEILENLYPDAKLKKRINHASQIWPFAHTMQIGDRVILPSKIQPVIYIGIIESEYKNDPNAENPFFHWRSVEWNSNPVPKSHFSQDLLYSFGAFLTICRIKRNNAEERLKKMEENGWKPETQKQIISPQSAKTIIDEADDESAEIDLEESGHTQIVKLIEAKFKGHNLTRLVKAILDAQGYTCWQSPEGPDGGVDILASDGPMGFGTQKICVEVKSGEGLTDRETVDKLLGAMSKFNANQGLFVSWGGYRTNVQKELASSYFNLRLWSQQDLLEELFDVYDKLEEEVKAELPLKRIWTVTEIE